MTEPMPARARRATSGLIGLIGVSLLFSQSLPGQLPGADGTGVAGWVGPGDEPFQAALQRLLVEGDPSDYVAGFGLAKRTGLPAVPLLWHVLGSENSNVVHRNAVLAAAMLAAGSALDERLYEWLGQRKAIKEERMMVALSVALAPPRQRRVNRFWSHSLGPERTPEEILAIAVRLAAARMPDVADDAPPLATDEVGMAAATAFAGLPVPAAIDNRHWDRSRRRHEEMYWRAALLAGCRRLIAGQQVEARLLQRARQAAELTDEWSAAARDTAMRYRALAGDIDPSGPRLDHRLLREVAIDSRSAERLRGWLGAQPVPRDEQPSRLAVAYVLSRSPSEVAADRAIWAGDPDIAAHVAVALAMRLLESDEPELQDATLPRLPEWQLVRWAAGHSALSADCDDPAVQILLELAVAGRLPRAAARRALEATLWRWGSHPGVGRFDAEQRLVRDLLLIGSDPGGKYVPQVRPEERYAPKGIDSDAFFEVAVAYYDFVRANRSPLPPSYRLR